MYGRTEVKAFSIFRTFLNGTKGSPMFPNGLIYEGIIIFIYNLSFDISYFNYHYKDIIMINLCKYTALVEL
jgi:hypothetical protein